MNNNFEGGEDYFTTNNTQKIFNNLNNKIINNSNFFGY